MRRSYRLLVDGLLFGALCAAFACTGDTPVAPLTGPKRNTGEVLLNNAKSQAGTAVSATVTATGHLERTYTWSVAKSVTPTTLTLDDGQSGTVDYTVSVAQTGAVDSLVVAGTVCLANEGSVATDGLTIVAQLESQNGAGPFAGVPNAQQAIAPAQQLAPGTSLCLGYRIAHTVVSATAYRVVARVTITNHSGWLPGGHNCPGSAPCAFGPEPKADFSVPSAPDETANASITVDDSDGQWWTFAASGSQTYARTFACPADAGTQNNTATIRGTSQSSSAAVDVTCHAAYATFTTIDPAGAVGASAHDINGLGQVVGQYQDAGHVDHGYVFDGTSYTVIDYPGTIPSYPGLFGGTTANGINDGGEISGAHGPTGLGVAYGFTYISGTFTPVATSPCALATEAQRINNSGEFVGNSEIAGGCYPNPTPYSYPLLGYRDDGHGTRTPIAPPGARSDQAFGVNDGGQVVGQYEDATGAPHGFLFSAGSYAIVDVPGAKSTTPRDINDAGTIVGSFVALDGKTHGFVKAGATFTTIDVPGAVLTVVEGINNLGQIVGTYYDGTGRTHGFKSSP